MNQQVKKKVALILILPGNLPIVPIILKNNELFIVEGDSAADQQKQEETGEQRKRFWIEEEKF